MFLAVDLPSEPLVSVGPALQHLGKTRPKPARMQRGGKSRPSVKPSPDLDTQKTVQEGEPVEEVKHMYRRNCIAC